MRPIDADTLEKNKYDNIENVTPNESAIWQQGWNDAIDAIMNYALTIDAEPMRHGLWDPKITALGTMVFKCSECQKYSDVHWAYCPRCGAKMDGEWKEDE